MPGHVTNETVHSSGSCHKEIAQIVRVREKMHDICILSSSLLLTDCKLLQFLDKLPCSLSNNDNRTLHF